MERDGDKIIMSKAERELFIETVETFIKTRQFDRKLILYSFQLVATKFNEAYRIKFKKDVETYEKKHGIAKVFPLLQTSMTLKQLFANVLKKKGIRFNRKALFHFEDEEAGNKSDAAIIASKIKKRVMAGASC